ncbi:MAG TPA: hypothetical protein VFS90_21480, partial [Pyrinomonadaceae bacterium]|nr:hypothetical protein [Pyrinomonadaceae bacterium]
MAFAAFAVADCKPKVAAPNNTTAPSKNETTVFMINFPFQNFENPRRQFATAMPKEHFSRKGAKAQRKPLETRQRFAPLRLCGRNIPTLQACQICRNYKTATP